MADSETITLEDCLSLESESSEVTLRHNRARDTDKVTIVIIICMCHGVQVSLSTRADSTTNFLYKPCLALMQGYIQPLKLNASMIL